MRKLLIAALSSVSLLASVSAFAQEAVRPQWNYQGSAVCPNGYDYFANQGLCIARGGYGGGPYGRPGYGGPRYEGGYADDGIAPRWNRLGSAVCPNGYDYHARSGLCRPQRY
jgi:hypothetical protein